MVSSSDSNWSAGRISHRKRAAPSPAFQKVCGVFAGTGGRHEAVRLDDDLDHHGRAVRVTRRLDERHLLARDRVRDRVARADHLDSSWLVAVLSAVTTG
jgi:hypothetical protein